MTDDDGVIDFDTLESHFRRSLERVGSGVGEEGVATEVGISLDKGASESIEDDDIRSKIQMHLKSYDLSAREAILLLSERLECLVSSIDTHIPSMSTPNVTVSSVSVTQHDSQEASILSRLQAIHVASIYFKYIIGT
jgi:hypothetical protein